MTADPQKIIVTIPNCQSNLSDKINTDELQYVLDGKVDTSKGLSLIHISLFGRLAQLKNVLLEKLAEMLTKVTGIDGKIGTSGDTESTDTLFGQVKDISEKMPTGTVKSVQRGYIQLTNNSDPTEMQITISKIDPQKSFVILNTDAVAMGTSRYYGQGLCLKSLTENKLVVRSETRGSIWFSWQVIECF